MNRRRFFGAGLTALLPISSKAQIEGLLGIGERWVKDNIDPGFLEAVKNGDRQKVDAWLRDAANRLQGEHVAHLVGLEDVVPAVLHLLEANPETRPEASWLRARADYFNVADRIMENPAVPPQDPGRHAPVQLPHNPTPEQERKAWQQELEGRSQPKGAVNWVPKLKPVFRGAGLPEALVWLAEVESSFDPGARSPVGAAGLYQLMPQTAQELGLKLHPRDERLVPEKNGKAAAAYLRQLHRRFKDWRLALAAYNAGPGRVSEVLKRRRASSFDAISPSLPAETQMYVPKFEAVLKRREGLSLSGLGKPSTV